MSFPDGDIANALKTYGLVHKRFILRLGKEDGKFEPWYETDFEQDFSGYLACLQLSRIHKAVEKRMSEQKKLKTFTKREAKKAEKAKIGFAKRKTKEQKQLDWLGDIE